MARPNTEFMRVDAADMPPNARAAWEALQKARERFEAIVLRAMQKAKTIPAGQEARFSYKLGGFHVGFADVHEVDGKPAGKGRELFG